MTEGDRFADPGTILHEMATHFMVVCPKCEGRAQVLTYEDTWRMTCSKCFHVEKEGHWYGKWNAYVQVKCRECHEPLRRSAEVSGEWAKLKMKCENCGDECEYEARLSRVYQKDGLMCDPHFGLQLWLQRPFNEDIFWAYHYDHLDLLEQYVRAKLRERGVNQKGSKNSLMFSRIPTFISSARNRKEILKLIGELKVK